MQFPKLKANCPVWTPSCSNTESKNQATMTRKTNFPKSSQEIENKLMLHCVHILWCLHCTDNSVECNPCLLLDIFPGLICPWGQMSLRHTHALLFPPSLPFFLLMQQQMRDLLITQTEPTEPDHQNYFLCINLCCKHQACIIQNDVPTTY